MAMQPLRGRRRGVNVRAMADSVVTEAEARYLAEIADDCERLGRLALERKTTEFLAMRVPLDL